MDRLDIVRDGDSHPIDEKIIRISQREADIRTMLQEVFRLVRSGILAGVIVPDSMKDLMGEEEILTAFEGVLRRNKNISDSGRRMIKCMIGQARLGKVSLRTLFLVNDIYEAHPHLPAEELIWAFRQVSNLREAEFTELKRAYQMGAPQVVTESANDPFEADYIA